MRIFKILALSLLLVACADEQSKQLGLVKSPGPSAPKVSFSEEVLPVLESRCIACHSCYDAPCQLKLTTYSGVERGGNKTKVYEPTRLREAELSRLFFDADGVLEWRNKGFHDVLGKFDPDTQAGVTSTLAGMLDLKENNPLADASKQENMLISDDVPLNDPTQWQCSNDRAEFLKFAEDYPERGMPYALPGLDTSQAQIVKDWIAAGAQDDSDYSLTDYEISEIDKWEAWLNQSSLKGQLVARYVYEHLFLASLYFKQSNDERYFQLVRSRSAPGQPIDLIASRRPYDEPGVGRPYYRLRLNREAVVAKTHMPYALDERKQELWNSWFFETDYTVSQLPAYDIDSASNPFKTFEALPAKSRYQFMLDESNFIVKGFIKGPVCKGPTAVNVINEHFWVFFVDPDHQGGAEMVNYLARTKAILDLPAQQEDSLELLGAWDEYAQMEKQFLVERNKYIKQNLMDDGELGIDLIWDGEGNNPNSALTIYRHFDHASVQKGLIGQTPKTIWVIDYPLLERIHYLLVAGYDVYGNISHQLLSRIYMDFLRMEGESLFLAFMPDQARKELRKHWYRDADERIENFMALSDISMNGNSVVAEDLTPKLALLAKLEAHVSRAQSPQYLLNSRFSPELVSAINRLESQRGAAFEWLPETTLLEVESSQQTHYFTLTKNIGHLNNTSLLFEDAYLEPSETSVSLVPGFIGPRPNALMRVKEETISQFFEQLQNMKQAEDYTALMNRYGIRRTNAQFWEHYDRFQQGYRAFSPRDYGILDLNQLENR